MDYLINCPLAQAYGNRYAAKGHFLLFNLTTASRKHAVHNKNIGALSCQKTLINFRPFTVARMPAKPILKIAGAKYAQNSHAYIIH